MPFRNRFIPGKKKKVYGYGRRRPARKGLLALFLWVASFLCLALLVAISSGLEGAAGGITGALGLSAFIVSLWGVALARASFHEPDRAYGVSRTALILNVLLCVIFVLLFISGLRG